MRYTGVPTGLWAYCPPFGETWLELRSAVEEALAFAGARGLEPWGRTFAEALAQGVAERPSSAYSDMVPDHGVSLERRRLLALATRAHVFGGMGSWNDLGFGDAGIQAEYDGISRRVFTATMYALAAVVNVDPDR